MSENISPEMLCNYIAEFQAVAKVSKEVGNLHPFLSVEVTTEGDIRIEVTAGSDDVRGNFDEPGNWESCMFAIHEDNKARANSNMTNAHKEVDRLEKELHLASSKFKECKNTYHSLLEG